MVAGTIIGALNRPPFTLTTKQLEIRRKRSPERDLATKPRSAVSFQMFWIPRQSVYIAWWHTTTVTPGLCIRTRSRTASWGRALCLEPQRGFSGQMRRGHVPGGGIVTTVGHISRIQTPLCLNRDASQIACKGCHGETGLGLGGRTKRKEKSGFGSNRNYSDF